MNLDIMQWKLRAAACLLVVFGTAFLWYQSRAKSCSHHSHLVGRIAVVIGCYVHGRRCGNIALRTLALDPVVE